MKRKEILNISCKALKGKWNKKRLKYLLEFIPQNHLNLIYEINLFEDGDNKIEGIDKPFLAWVREFNYIDLNISNLNLSKYKNSPMAFGYHTIPHEIGHIVFKHGGAYHSSNNYISYSNIIPYYELDNDHEIEADCYAQYIFKLSNYRNYFKKFPHPIKEKVISLF